MNGESKHLVRIIIPRFWDMGSVAAAAQKNAFWGEREVAAGCEMMVPSDM